MNGTAGSKPAGALDSMTNAHPDRFTQTTRHYDAWTPPSVADVNAEWELMGPHDESASSMPPNNSRGAASVIHHMTIAPLVNERIIVDIGICLRRYFHVEASNAAVRAIVEEAYKSTDGNYGMQHAITWANGFKIPQEALDADLQLFRASGSNFDRMVADRLHSIQPYRFSRDRIETVISKDNPELRRLLDLADGMQVPLPSGFRPNGQRERPPLRSKYIQAHSAVNKLYHESHKEGLAFYLPIDVATNETSDQTLFRHIGHPTRIKCEDGR